MRRPGYTLLEVTLFLAISSSLAVIALVGLLPRIQNVRFTQSVRALEADLSAQFSARNDGQNLRALDGCQSRSSGGLAVDGPTTSEPGADDSCIINGVVAIFGAPDTKSITFRDVISLRQPQATAGCSSATNISSVLSCFKSSIIDADVHSRSKSYSNGLKQISPTTGFVYLRDPQGNGSYSFQIVNQNPSDYKGLINDLDLRTAATNRFNVCLELASRKTYFEFVNNSLAPIIHNNRSCP